MVSIRYVLLSGSQGSYDITWNMEECGSMIRGILWSVVIWWVEGCRGCERAVRRGGSVCACMCACEGRGRGGRERKKNRQINREKGSKKNTEIKCVSMNQIIKRFSPKADSDLLILWASFSISPWAPDLSTRCTYSTLQDLDIWCAGMDRFDISQFGLDIRYQKSECDDEGQIDNMKW